jgi:uncharacterized membrane protein YagU involved in acid resistance
MKNFWKRFSVFFGLIIIGCNLSITLQFLHKLSGKDWMYHIIFAIIFALCYMLILYFYKDKKAKKKG